MMSGLSAGNAASNGASCSPALKLPSRIRLSPRASSSRASENMHRERDVAHFAGTGRIRDQHIEQGLLDRVLADQGSP